MKYQQQLESRVAYCREQKRVHELQLEKQSQLFNKLMVEGQELDEQIALVERQLVDITQENHRLVRVLEQLQSSLALEVRLPDLPPKVIAMLPPALGGKGARVHKLPGAAGEIRVSPTNSNTPPLPVRAHRPPTSNSTRGPPIITSKVLEATPYPEEKPKGHQGPELAASSSDTPVGGQSPFQHTPQQLSHQSSLPRAARQTSIPGQLASPEMTAHSWAHPENVNPQQAGGSNASPPWKIEGLTTYAALQSIIKQLDSSPNANSNWSDSVPLHSLASGQSNYATSQHTGQLLRHPSSDRGDLKDLGANASWGPHGLMPYTPQQQVNPAPIMMESPRYTMNSLHGHHLSRVQSMPEIEMMPMEHPPIVHLQHPSGSYYYMDPLSRPLHSRSASLPGGPNALPSQNPWEMGPMGARQYSGLSQWRSGAHMGPQYSAHLPDVKSSRLS